MPTTPAPVDGPAAPSSSSIWVGGYSAEMDGDATGIALLHVSGDGAVIFSWGAHSPVQGFSGFGQVHLAGRCLTSKERGQQLRWEGCRGGDKAQVWSLSRGTLVNELALCADVEGDQANNARVLGIACSGSLSQRWNEHSIHSARGFAARIVDDAARAAFLRTAQTTEPGTFISLATGLAVMRNAAQPATSVPMVISAGGGNVISQGQ